MCHRTYRVAEKCRHFFSAGRQQREILQDEGKRRVGWLESASGYGKAETPYEREFRECGN